jgi:uncharacterized OB-fold protein
MLTNDLDPFSNRPLNFVLVLDVCSPADEDREVGASQADIPTPVESPEAGPYWAAARSGELVMQKCLDCERHQFFPRSVCQQCLGSNLEWVEMSGRGKIISFSTVHRPPMDYFVTKIPYVLAMIALDEGPQMLSEIVGGTEDDIELDMDVDVVFEAMTDEYSLPKFQPRNAA